jgi:hypothetical protein
MMRVLLLSVALLLAAETAPAQTAGELQRSLERALVKKQLPIRDFLADPRIEYAWDTDHLEHEREKVFTLGMFQAEAVKVHEAQGKVDGMTIAGTRRTLLDRDPAAKDGLSKAAEKVTFEVNLKGADAATVQNLVGVLFFPDAEAAIKAVPGELAGFLLTKDVVGVASWKQGWVRIDGDWQQVADVEKIQPPKVKFAPEPEFSEEARKAKVHGGNVELGLSVGPDGTVLGVWLIRPVGLGLDEKAEEAVFRYKFEPAMYRGEAVGVAMGVEVNFQMF